MVLSDRDIKKRLDDGSLSIEPLDRDNIEPASVDLHLGDDFKLIKQEPCVSLDSKRELSYKQRDSPILISTETLVLGTTKEYFSIPDDLCANVLGRSSLGRLGISIHQTAGFIDPGFEGEITLELSNHGPSPVRLSEGDRVCQIVFQELSSPSERPYGHSGSQYQNQSGATESGMQFE